MGSVTFNLQDIVYKSLLSMSTEKGINASGREEVYGCIFGRDSAITILKILKVCRQNPHNTSIDQEELLKVSRRALLTLTQLQGQWVNRESGEEPGKFIHEYRTERFEHLVALTPSWYVYPDNTLRNYDSLDATPLTLIAIYNYFDLTHDTAFISQVLPAVEKGLEWMLSRGDPDNDGLTEYEFSSERKYGGLRVQSWTDSIESLQQADGTFPLYPIAPVEVQGYYWLALKLWADFFEETKQTKQTKAQQYSKKLLKRAQFTKTQFNKQFFMKDAGYMYPVQALDGHKKQIRTMTGNPLLLLWATYRNEDMRECIVDTMYLQDMVARAFMADMFDEEAGIRTMSTLSKTYDPSQNSYHNGSFWPKLNGLAHEGLMKWGFHEEARKLRLASLKPLEYFQSPIELYIKTGDGTYAEYKNVYGQVSCREQAWSAAAALDMLTL
ncbi:hypothetical protein KAZ66_00660 [Candidatus Woesebacteria bacterium]|nr:hypothetical protein [Candidatus Woesebacteria bacterium]